MRLFGAGFAADYLARGVLLGSLAAGVVMRNAWLFTIGFAVFILLKLIVFHLGRLEPDTGDPVTAMQQRRYAGDKPV